MLATMLTSYLDSQGIQYGNPEDEAFVSHDGLKAAPSLYDQFMNRNVSISLGFSRPASVYSKRYFRSMLNDSLSRP